MKKFLLIIFLITISGSYLFAEEHKLSENVQPVSDKDIGKEMSEAMLKDMTEKAQKTENAYYNLKSCIPIKTDWLEIYGTENNRCRFKYVNYNCNLPMDVAKKYAEFSLKILNTENGTFNQVTDTPETKFINGILNDKNYCSAN